VLGAYRAGPATAPGRDRAAAGGGAMSAPGPALTPELAVDYLRELSADIRAAAVLTPEGEPIAGARELADAARALLAAAPEAAEIEVVVPGGAVHAARDERHAVVAVCGRFALPALIRYDLKVVLGELSAAGDDRPASTEAA
jgi:hypothetical protein